MPPDSPATQEGGEGEARARRREESPARHDQQQAFPACFVRRMNALDARTVDARPPAPRPHPPGGIRRVSTVLELQLRLPHAWPPGARHVAPRLWGIRLSLSHAFSSMNYNLAWVGLGWVGSDERGSHPRSWGNLGTRENAREAMKLMLHKEDIILRGCV